MEQKIYNYSKIFKRNCFFVVLFTFGLVTINPAKSIQTLRYASTGPEVKKLQQRLVSAGFLENNQVDGVFGKETKSAVMKFQDIYGLSPDGIVGYQTVEILEKQPISSQSLNSTSLLQRNTIPLGFMVVVVSVVFAAATGNQPDFEKKTTVENGVVHIKLTWRGYNFSQLKAYMDDKLKKTLEVGGGKAEFKLVITPESSVLKVECLENDEPVHTFESHRKDW